MLGGGRVGGVCCTGGKVDSSSTACCSVVVSSSITAFGAVKLSRGRGGCEGVLSSVGRRFTGI